jgi:hypothetical protein
MIANPSGAQWTSAHNSELKAMRGRAALPQLYVKRV